jgi:hypothetical protein
MRSVHDYDCERFCFLVVFVGVVAGVGGVGGVAGVVGVVGVVGVSVSASASTSVRSV